AWTLAAALRLGRNPWWIAATAAALAGTFLVRGVVGLVPAALLVWIAIDAPLRVPVLRLVAVAALAAIPLLVFDALHLSLPRPRFWSAYLERQVLPSFQA